MTFEPKKRKTIRQIQKSCLPGTQEVSTLVIHSLNQQPNSLTDCIAYQLKKIFFHIKYIEKKDAEGIQTN